MAELSFPWPQTSPQTGDGRAYTAEEWADHWFAVYAQVDNDGLLYSPNALGLGLVTNPSGAVLRLSPCTALIRGHFYLNSGNVEISATAPGTGSRRDRFILRCDWTGGVGTQYTIRAAIKQGTSGVVPSLTQTDNTCWEISLAYFDISSGGTISNLTSETTYCKFGTKVSTGMIEDDAVTNAKIGAAAVGATEIGTGAVTETKIGSAAVTNAKIGAAAVGTSNLADDAVTNAKIGAGAVGTAELADDSVTNAKIGAGAVGTTELAAGAVTAAKITAGTITATELASNAVVTAKIADDAVTQAKIGAGAVGTTELADASVTAAKLAGGGTTPADNSVSTAKIVDDAVTQAKIGAGAVGTTELASGAVATGNIANSAVTSDKIGTAAVIEAKIADGAVTGGKIASSSISAAKLATNSVATGNIQDDAVTNAKIGAGAVGATELGTGAVTTAKIYDGHVTTAKIADEAVTAAKIANRVRFLNLPCVSAETNDADHTPLYDYVEGAIQVPASKTGLITCHAACPSDVIQFNTLYIWVMLANGTPRNVSLTNVAIRLWTGTNPATKTSPAYYTTYIYCPTSNVAYAALNTNITPFAISSPDTPAMIGLAFQLSASDAAVHFLGASLAYTADS